MMVEEITPVEANNAIKDHLWAQITSLPYFRAVLRAVEARFYENIELPAPCLDLGCGDGHFASLAFSRQLEVGLDPWIGPLREAEKHQVYAKTINSAASSIPYPDGYFSSSVSNSVLEHIKDLDPVLKELARVLKPGALFVFCVPNQRFLPTLSVARALDSLRLKAFARAYRRFFDRISRHYHCDVQETWQGRLARHGFEIISQWDYFSPRAQAILEWGHYFGLPSLISHFLFRKWILVPTRWNLKLTEAITRPVYNEPSMQEKGVYTFYVTRKLPSE